ncbi:MAG: hypothetical protein N2645_19000 [Clostridia bacterium]|nr:hypothetical protein [Clostridia bacterium]
MENYKEQVFLDIYRMYHRDIQDWEILYSKHAGVHADYFIVSVEKLREEGLIDLPDESITYCNESKKPLDVILDNVRITEKGNRYARRLSM